MTIHTSYVRSDPRARCRRNHKDGTQNRLASIADNCLVLTSSGVISVCLRYCNPVAVEAERFDPVVGWEVGGVQ